MKKLNLAAVLAACLALKTAENNVEFDVCYKLEYNLERDRAALTAAQNEFDDAAAPLQAVIKIAEGRATARTVTPRMVCEMVSEIEGKLSITKKAMKGVKVFRADPNAQTFPSAYKYTPESTQFSLEHNGKTWFLTDIGRYTCSANRGGIGLTDAAKEKILENASRL